jgi:hypothetical protein
MGDAEEEVFYQQPLQEILWLISMDNTYPEDGCYLLTDALSKIYQAFDCEYNDCRNNSVEIESKWVEEQLILLPNHLLSLGKKTESIRLYKKLIYMQPSLLGCHQIYMFPVRCVASCRFVSGILSYTLKYIPKNLFFRLHSLKKHLFY